ncbi:hypothetical protein [Kouleothrix sp.]|uniref:choice-of-anchor Y domain-containing protein n=1 Tax=Kouleothrix sp. TaxID=2779161 RepID=UPI0039188DBA
MSDRWVLYHAERGGTPDSQGQLLYRSSPEAQATQTFVGGATVLDTSANIHDAAGYFLHPRVAPVLDRRAGYALHFTVQLLAEDHAPSDKNGDGSGDRAGFSVIALSSDTRGIELGFWLDQVWAQEQGAAEPPAGTLFTHAEHARFDTSRMASYTLMVRDDAYALSSNGQVLLTGRLRDYTAFEGPVNPYRTPNFIFLGDDSGSASALVRLAYAALEIEGGASS